MKTETIEVGVRQRVLWIGAEAYPLQNIARVSTAEVVYRKGAAVARFVGYTLFWILLGIVALVALFVTGVLQTDEQTELAITVAGGVVGLLILVRLVALLSLLLRRGLWALIIETAGTSHRAVISADKRLITTLVREIVTAINDPSATFSHTITNIVMGDQYNQYGRNSTGKVTH
ncbi:DUF6232 family protein [Dactylosporangium sp. NPDC048998]|uniref:DUF6232 family protein n=1 Tax=Dactylosporangium sp. NPDC048998 TaxID=3363976 RepID=UPI00371E597C